MIRIIFTCLLFLIINNTTNAQSYQWAKNFGSSINTEGKSMVVDKSGFVYTAINNVFNGVSAGFENFSIKKQNSLGNEMWTVAFSSSGSALNLTNCQSITVDLSGNLYITGYHSGIVNYNGTTILTPTNNNFQAFIIKLNTNGGLVWSKSLGDSYETKGVSIALDRNFNVYTTGYYTGSAFGSNAIGRDIFIIKHDSSGNQKWLRRIGGAGNDISTSIAIDLNNNVLTTGYYSDIVDFDPGINTFNLTSTGKDIFISKLDSSGNFVWAKSLQGVGDKRGSSIKTDIQNNIVIGGSFNGTIDLNPGVNSSIVTSLGQYDVFVCKLDPNGNYIWSKKWGSSFDDACNEISIDSFGNVFTTGSFQSTTDFDPSSGVSNLTATSTIANGNTDMYISKLFSNGNFGWVKRIGGTGITVGNTITVSNNNLYTAGFFKYTTDFNPDETINNLTSSSPTNNDAFILKLSTAITCTQPNLSISSLGCTNSPITLTSDTGIAQIQWYLNGNLISTQQGWNTNGVTIAGNILSGSTSTRLNGPNAVYVDSIGNVYVADVGNHRIQKFIPGSNIGITVAGGNGAGSASNQLNSPTGVYFDKQQNMYVSDYNNNRVQKFIPGSTIGITVAGGNGAGSSSTNLYHPTGLFVDSLNNLYVSDAVNNRIQKFPPNSTSATPGVTVAGGNGYGNAMNQISNPFHVFVDDSLAVYIADWGNGRIQKWKKGSTIGTTVATNLNYPSGVFVDKNFILYVSDQNNHRLLKYLPSSTSGVVIAGGYGQGTASNQITTPGRMFFDKIGNLYVPDNPWNVSNRIQKFSLRNSLTYTPTTAGTYSAIVTLFNGCTFASDPVVITNVSLLQDTTKVCADSVAILNVGSGYSSYQWSNGATSNSITVSQSGMYNVTVTSSNGCIIKDSSYVSIVNAQIITNDTSICRGDSVLLRAGYRTSPVFDNSGNRYETVNIGTQIWTTSNLRTGKYNDGSSITQIVSNSQWITTSTGGWCFYNNASVSYDNIYGRLYNKYAVEDTRGLVPTGWHIASDQDFSTLSSYLGGTSAAGGKLKSINLWQTPNTGANNSSGFSALPGGQRSATTGLFRDATNYGFWWTKRIIGVQLNSYQLSYNSTSLTVQGNTSSRFGFSVRFLKDQLINYSYSWSNGSTNQVITVAPTQTTTYYCTISNGITSCIDSVTITVGINPFQDTTKICSDSTILDAGSGFAQYSWNTGDSTQTIVVRNNGFYKVTVTNASGCSSSDSTYVSFFSANILQNDTAICRGNPIILSLEADTSNFVSDVDGNIYPTVTIGNQTWLQKNLNTSRYRNGDVIPQVTDPAQWSSLTTGAWCWYNNDSATYASTYGKLYNWYAVNDPRGLAPDFWRIPTDADWSFLENYLGNNLVAGGKLKEAGLVHWQSPNASATNSTMFTALPGGRKEFNNNNFIDLGIFCFLWSSTAFDSNESWLRDMGNLNGYTNRNHYNKRYGFSVRCLRNSNSYLWSTGDTSLSINVAPQQTTTYYATASNGINSCVDSVKVIVPILDTSITILDPSATICSNNGSVRLQAGIATSYQWLFNGVPIPNSNTRIDTARQTGLYRVVVTNALGCNDTSRAIQVNIFSLPQTPLVTANGPTTFCSTSTVTLSTTSSNVTYQWYNNGSLLVSNTSSNITVNQSGLYTVVVSNANGCTSVSSPIAVTVNQLPNATISYNQPFCRTLATAQSVIRTGTSGGTYSSTPAGLSINSSTGAIIPSASIAGTYAVSYTIAASNSCPAVIVSTNVTITAQPSAIISYSGSPYCRTLTNAQPVTISGTQGGNFTSTPVGLSINSSNGAITPSASTAGTYTVTYTIAASNGCAAYTAPSTSVTITAQPSAAIFYGNSPYCRSITTAQPVTRSGTAGGTYSSTPAGLSINSTTGAITPSASTAGTYTVTYTIAASNGCGAYTAPSASVTITAQPAATISYGGSPYCRTLTSAQSVTRIGTAGGGYTSTPTGLSINSSTGAITPSASTAGTYTITYTVPSLNGCAAYTAPSTTVTITTQPSATIFYGNSPYCRSITTTQPVTRTGTAGGAFSSTPVGLSINSLTGAITPSASTAGTYTVTYTIAASNGCGIFNTSTTVFITAQPSATISYSSSPYCRTLTNAQPVTISGTPGGNFTSTPAGLSINTSTGAITPSASTAGTYTVSYTVAASNGCAAYTAPSTSVTITAQPSATILYGNSPYCRSITTAQSVTRSGTAGGTYSSTPAGLSINSITGAIIPSASTAGTYAVTYTIAAANGCGVFTTSTSLIINAEPTATISYSGSPYCRTLTSAQSVTRSGAAGGSYTSTPAGLSINSTSGAITPSLSQAGTYTVLYSVPASGGCAITTFSCPVVISSTLPVANISPSSGNICEGSTLTLTTSGGNLYNWYRNGTLIAGATNSTYQASTSGTYTVQIFSTNGCNAFASNSSILTYTKKPTANFNYNSYCIRKPILYTSTSDTINSRPLTYRWTFGDGVGTSTLMNPTYTFMNAGSYNVTLTVRSILCPSLQSQSIKNIRIDTFIANLRYPNLNVLIPPGIQLKAREFTPSATYSWSPTAGLNSSNIYNPYFNINAPQQYLITITNPSGCIIKDTLKVNVFTTQDIFVPKGFSPNNDGVNDKLFPYLVGIRVLNYFKVYNRWGQQVFETNIEGDGWDGKYRGVLQPLETYTWIAEGVGLDGKVVKRSGGSLLMR